MCPRAGAACWSCVVSRVSGRPLCWGMRPTRLPISRWPALRVSSRRWSCRSRRCISCAGGCWIAWTGCRGRSARLWLWRSDCSLAARRIVSWSGWRCWACCPMWPPASRCWASSMMRSGWIRPRRQCWRSSPAGWAGSNPVASRIGQSFRRRFAALPEPTMRLLLLAAADPTGDPALLWRAADGLGISAAEAAPAEIDGLLTVGDRVTFRHPLVRSAIYQAAPGAERRRAHLALAEATHPGADPDRRAWHRARATAGTDEEVAAELERSAGRAQARGGFAAAAEFLERSAALTLEPARRAKRALAAAHAGQV